MARVLVTGGSGFIGGALLGRLLERGDDVVALARSDAAAAALAARGAEVARGDVLDEPALAAAMRGCALVYHVAGINTMCPPDPAALFHVNVRGAEAAVRAAGRAGVARLVLTSSAAALGEAHGTIGREDSPHRGSFLSVYERSKHDGEKAALAAAPTAGVEVVAVNPSSVQGPGRSGGTGRILIAYLNGRLKAFVDTTISLAGHRRCGRRPPARGRARDAGRALRPVRLDDDLARGARRRLGAVRDPGSRPAAARAGRARRGCDGRGRLPGARPDPAGVPRDGPDAPARASLRRLARFARAGPRLHARARDVPADDRLGAGRGPRHA